MEAAKNNSSKSLAQAIELLTQLLDPEKKVKLSNASRAKIYNIKILIQDALDILVDSM